MSPIAKSLSLSSIFSSRMICFFLCVFFVKSNFILTVNPPKIIRHPENISVATGASTVFTVEATGDNLQFQWQRNDKDIDRDKFRLQCNHTDNISTLRIEHVENSDKGHYKCLVKNPVQERVLTTHEAELCVCEFSFYVYVCTIFTLEL